MTQVTQQSAITPAHFSILQLQPFDAGKSDDDLAREYDVNDVVKLATNENPLGSSPYVTLAITNQLNGLARYPDGNALLLRQAIADFNDIGLEQVTLGNGSEELLHLIGRAFVSQDDAIIYSQYSFVVYSLVPKMLGATGIEVPAVRYGLDLDAMLDAIKAHDNAKVVFIANPNNPTGTLLSKEQVNSFVSQVPNHVLVVLDEAYVEYCPEADNRHLIDEFDNVIVLRTFSKAYGLAGMRVGYALARAEVIDMINRMRQPFNVNLLAQAAALAALSDQSFIAHVNKINDGQKRWLYKQFDALGLNFVPSHTNFVMVNVGDAKGVQQALLEQGIIVLALNGYGLDEWLRITVGTPEDNTRLIDTLRDTLESM